MNLKRLAAGSVCVFLVIGCIGQGQDKELDTTSAQGEQKISPNDLRPDDNGTNSKTTSGKSLAGNTSNFNAGTVVTDSTEQRTSSSEEKKLTNAASCPTGFRQYNTTGTKSIEASAASNGVGSSTGIDISGVATGSSIATTPIGAIVIVCVPDGATATIPGSDPNDLSH
jgi:hypothetical protein